MFISFVCFTGCGASKHTLADLLPPDVLNGASTHAVDTLVLVLADNEVAQVATLLDNEDGVALSTLRLARALDATAEGLHATIEGLASGNVLGLIESDGTS